MHITQFIHTINFNQALYCHCLLVGLHYLSKESNIIIKLMKSAQKSII